MDALTAKKDLTRGRKRAYILERGQPPGKGKKIKFFKKMFLIFPVGGQISFLSGGGD